jgi:hypothetical protein
MSKNGDDGNPSAENPKKRRGPGRRFEMGNTIGFKKGQSGNAGGRPRSQKEYTEAARAASLDALARLHRIVNDPNSSDTAATAAAREINDRAWGKPIQPSITEHSFSGDGGGSTALLRAAQAADANRGRNDPPRLSEPNPNEQPMSNLLAAIRADKSDELAEAEYQKRYGRSPKPAQITGPAEAPALADDFKISGQKSCSEAPECAPLPERLLGEPEPITLESLEGRPLPEKPKPKPAGSGVPSGFAEFTARREAEREERRKTLPGSQIPMKELQPDPVGESMQGAPEYVNFTLAGNGRIKRC